jgi:hypothetical protein
VSRVSRSLVSSAERLARVTSLGINCILVHENILRRSSLGRGRPSDWDVAIPREGALHSESEPTGVR